MMSVLGDVGGWGQGFLLDIQRQMFERNEQWNERLSHAYKQVERHKKGPREKKDEQAAS
jgi:hypothetical protein